jgi:uncharacterized membrane protein
MTELTRHPEKRSRTALRSELLIQADLERVWALTLDVERWPELTPTITEVVRLDDGPLAVGSRARITQPGQRPAVWTVSRLDPGVAFEWWAKVGPVTMTGGHHLRPDPRGCVNLLTLDITGRGAGLVGRLVGRRIGEAIERENRGFKQEAEAAQANGDPVPVLFPGTAC